MRKIDIESYFYPIIHLMLFMHDALKWTPRGTQIKLAGHHINT